MLTLFSTSFRIKAQETSLAHRYMLVDSTHKGRSPLQEADNKVSAGEQRPLQPGKEMPAPRRR